MITLRTRIYTVTGFYIDVQEPYELVKKLIAETECGNFIDVTLESGKPVSFDRNHIACFSKINEVARYPLYGYV